MMRTSRCTSKAAGVMPRSSACCLPPSTVESSPIKCTSPDTAGCPKRVSIPRIPAVASDSTCTSISLRSTLSSEPALSSITLCTEPLARSIDFIPSLKAPAAKMRKTTAPEPATICKRRGMSRNRLRVAYAKGRSDSCNLFIVYLRSDSTSGCFAAVHAGQSDATKPSAQAIVSALVVTFRLGTNASTRPSLPMV